MVGETWWQFENHAVHGLCQMPDQPEAAAQAKTRPAVLLVHGFGASTDHWRYNIPVLASHYEVLSLIHI